MIKTKYRIWVVIVRAIIMVLPALLTMMLEWLFDNCEKVLLWLDSKLPNALKRGEEK